MKRKGKKEKDVDFVNNLLRDIIIPQGKDGEMEFVPAGYQLESFITILKKTLPPPKPASEYEARMYQMARAMGWKPVVGHVYRLDIVNRFLEVNVTEPPGMRLLSIAHEIGHAIRFFMNPPLIDRLTEIRAMPNSLRSNEERRLLIKDEILAWREGMRICRDMGVKFNSSRSVRQFRRDCIATYRLTNHIPAAHSRNLIFR